MMEFDREELHAMIEKSIYHLKQSGMRIGKKNHDALYRMGCVGAMSAIAQLGEEPPPILMIAVMSGRPLTDKTWQEVLGR